MEKEILKHWRTLDNEEKIKYNGYYDFVMKYKQKKAMELLE